MVTTMVSAWKDYVDIAPDFAEDIIPREILGFFKKHPHTRFDKLAIFHTLNVEAHVAFLDEALGNLVEQGVVAACVENGVELYSLKLS